MDIFPAFYPLAGRRVVIAGDGEPADSKARLFASSPAEVTRLVGDQALDPDAYVGAAIIFVASWDEAFATAAAAVARTAGVPVNVVDRPAMSDFYTPAIVDRGAVVAAIGTGGGAPVLASLLRAEIEARIPAGAGEIAALLSDRRPALRAAFPDLSDRRSFFRAMLAGDVARAAGVGDVALAGRLLDDAIAQGWKALGGVSFIALHSGRRSAFAARGPGAEHCGRPWSRARERAPSWSATPVRDAEHLAAAAAQRRR